MRIVVVAWLVLGASVALAQTPILFTVYFPPQLKEYLALSDDQITRMNNVREQLFLQQPKVERQDVL